MNPEVIRKILLNYSCQRVRMAGEKLGKAMSEGHSAKEAWDYHAGISLAECGISYPIYWTYQNLYEKIYVGTKNERNR